MTENRLTNTLEDQYFRQCFASLNTHTLEQQQRAELLNRVDEKYLIRLADLPHILRRCAEEYSVLSLDGDTAPRYRTCYYDTRDMSCFLAHHNGVLPRFKIRTREYCNSHSCFLEIKTKTNKERTIKERTPVPTCDPDELRKNLLLPGEFSAMLEVTYKRTTLLHGRDEERVTFDHNLSFCNIATKCTAATSGTLIVEVKNSGKAGQSIMCRALRQAGYRPVNFSKYCNGCLLTNVSGSKHNRFKSQLAALHRTSPIYTGVAL